ncbi:MAG TPA: AI-2E family transporter [Candidatus Paceibacterota bacterium]|nr:AI-2E family transporter [Candidatus Paceibacterota bacterium]
MAEITQKIEISTASVFRALLVILGFYLLYRLSGVVLVLLFAIVIASAVQPFVRWFEGRGVPRVVAVLVLYLLIFALGVVLSSLVIPSVLSDMSSLSSYLPKFTAQLSTSLDQAQAGAPRYLDFLGEIQNIVGAISGYLQQVSQSALDLVASAFGGVISFLAIVVISFYLATMKNGVEGFLKAVIPERYEGYIVNLWQRVEAKVGLWLQGQLLLALIVGLLVFVGLSLLRVKFSLLFAILAMLLEIIPVAGPVLAAIPAIFVALLQSPILGLYVLIMWIIIQQTESHVLVPLVLGKTLGMNPIVVILAILVGSELAGIPGALLGVPVATIIVEILDDMARLKTSRRAA